MIGLWLSDRYRTSRREARLWLAWLAPHRPLGRLSSSLPFCTLQHCVTCWHNLSASGVGFAPVPSSLGGRAWHAGRANLSRTARITIDRPRR
jgi:hypothetical protein